MSNREEIAKQNGMSLEFVNWFFDNKKDGCGNQWFLMMAAMWEGWKALQAERDELFAENVAQREQAEEIYAAGYNHGHLNTVDGIAYADCVKDDFYGLAMQLMVEAETPATDAFLREQMAKGVDVARNSLIAFVDDEVGPNTNVPGLIRGSEVCASLAAQLRAGEAV